MKIPIYWNAYVYIDSDEESTTVQKKMHLKASLGNIMKMKPVTSLIGTMESAPGYDVQYYDTEWSDLAPPTFSEIDIDNQSGIIIMTANYSDESVTPPYADSAAYAEAMVYQVISMISSNW